MSNVDKYYAQTHQVENQPPALEDYNLYSEDTALQEAIHREGAHWAEQDIARFGAECGLPERIALGFAANANRPQLHTHDRFGHRIDMIEFHPSYHALMDIAISEGLHSSPWLEPKLGAHVARAAKYYLHTQVEAAHGCPITMTFAAIPALQHQPELLTHFGPKIMATQYDGRNVPDTMKHGLTIGMAMTEKQGGSDVRTNSTRAFPIGQEGPGAAYELVGHKWFVSAPMCDAFLILAQAPGGLSCFLVPRWRPDGSKNAIHIQQLKNKMGNVANASSECELRGAFGWLVGQEGRGVRTIIEMVAITRYDCMIGSSSGMRQATVQAIHHARHRSAFGATLVDQPLMQNVLADLAVESEAAMTMTMRLARSLDQQDNEHERLLTRILTPIGKYWICKRTPNHAYEAMEVIGGMGVMENTIMPRLFREAPVNAIWEGSGNVQCLDIIRALNKEPEVLSAYFVEVEQAMGADARFDQAVHSLKALFSTIKPDDYQYSARYLADHLAKVMQGALLLQYAPAEVADAFCASRLSADTAANYGCLPAGTAARTIIDRCFNYNN